MYRAVPMDGEDITLNNKVFNLVEVESRGKFFEVGCQHSVVLAHVACALPPVRRSVPARAVSANTKDPILDAIRLTLF